MTREEKIAMTQAVYDAWVASHADDPSFNPDNPTDEQENELAFATAKAMPEIVNQDWAAYVDSLSEAERELLLQSPAFQPQNF